MNNQYSQQPIANVDATKPISVLGYIGYQILFSIPCVGFICMIIFAFTSKNVNLKNYALAILIVRVIAVVLVVLMYLFFGAMLLGALESSGVTTTGFIG